MRHVSALFWGTKRLLDALVGKIPDATDVNLWGREELSAVTRESLKRAYNEKVSGPTFFVNARDCSRSRPAQSRSLPSRRGGS
jgi:hypothetical protein